ncbi:MAG: hypothetical protein KA029_17560, partial [Ilumatobacteraceae bacterium]|nr:hypothetical protein [Ilumatobacteraceae bacterium]
MTTLESPDTAPTAWAPPESDPTANPTTNPTADPTGPTMQRAPASRVARFLHGRPDDPVWVRPALIGLLAATGVLYIWGLGASGWANDFYSAAVQAGTRSWKAFF